MSKPSEEARLVVAAIVRGAGGFGGGLSEVVEEIARREHPTHQQSITRFCQAWLSCCGSDDYQSDGRNAASAELGRSFREAGLHERCIPFI